MSTWYCYLNLLTRNSKPLAFHNPWHPPPVSSFAAIKVCSPLPSFPPSRRLFSSPSLPSLAPLGTHTSNSTASQVRRGVLYGSCDGPLQTPNSPTDLFKGIILYSRVGSTNSFFHLAASMVLQSLRTCGLNTSPVLNTMKVLRFPEHSDILLSICEAPQHLWLRTSWPDFLPTSHSLSTAHLQAASSLSWPHTCPYSWLHLLPGHPPTPPLQSLSSSPDVIES